MWTKIIGVIVGVCFGSAHVIAVAVLMAICDTAKAWEGNADVGSVYCYVIERTDVHSQPNGNIITILRDGDGVIVSEQKWVTNLLWDYVAKDSGEARARYISLGWVLDGVLRCPIEGAEKR
jgi:hypothetical protein